MFPWLRVFIAAASHQMQINSTGAAADTKVKIFEKGRTQAALKKEKDIIYNNTNWLI